MNTQPRDDSSEDGIACHWRVVSETWVQGLPIETCVPRKLLQGDVCTFADDGVEADSSQLPTGRMPVAPGDDSSGAAPAEAPEDDPDGPHPFVYPADPADYAAAQKAYDDEMHARIIARLNKIPYSKRGRWRPVDGL